MIRAVFIGISICLSAGLFAQDTLYWKNDDPIDTLHRIGVLGLYQGDSVVLRWAPAYAEDWLNLNKDGYQIRRYQLNKEGLPVAGSMQEYAVAPWSPDVFQARIDDAGDYVLAAAQCLYGAWESAQEGKLNMHGRYQELQNRFGIALLSADVDKTAGHALGLRFADRDVQENAFYLYQVIPADTSLGVIPGFTTILTTPKPLPAPRIDHLVEAEGYINVKWLRDEHSDDYSAYWIEAATPGGTFKRLNTEPFVGGVSETYPSAYFSYKHAVENYQPHQYRIIGISPFGELSAPSDVKKGQARDRTAPPIPVNLKVKCDETTSIVAIEWDAVEAADLAGYEVRRAFIYDGIYEPVQKDLITKTHYQEVSQDTRRIFYYQVIALDTAGNGAQSRIVQAAFRDTIAPATPTGLNGSIDSNGVVRLHWDRGTEPDLRGYYIYMANQKDHFFTNMTPKPVSDTMWTDTITLRTFTEHIYYRVSAADFHSHLSEWTEPIELFKPDTIRPFPPSFSGYRVEKDHIILNYLPSRSKDVKSHVLRKRLAREEAWVTVTEFQLNDQPYLDYKVDPGQTYEYELTAIDDAGLTPLQPAFLRVKFVDQRRPEPPVIALLDTTQSSLTLSLSGFDEKTAECIILRSVNDGPFTTTARIGVQQTFEDKSWSATKTYAYKVKAVWNDGQKSDDSNILTIGQTQ